MTIAKLLTLLAALILVALSHAAALGAQPTQAALVKAWEEIQRKDPDTVMFEKIGEGRYRFKTNRFPFDGELKFLKATVDDTNAAYPLGASQASIDCELVGLSKEVARKYVHSYSKWQETNYLFFDKESGSWMPSGEYRARRALVSAEQANQPRPQEQETMVSALWLTLLMYWGPVLLLTGFWFWIVKRTGVRRQREYMNMGLAHMQRSAEPLERIADALEKKGGEASARGAADE